jgi:hypothetical protein
MGEPSLLEWSGNDTSNSPLYLSLNSASELIELFFIFSLSRFHILYIGPSGSVPRLAKKS